MSRATPRVSYLGWALSCLLAPWLIACPAPTCDTDGGTPLEYREGLTNAAGTYYETGASDQPFLYFPGGRRYRFRHGLRGVPSTFEARLAFSPCPFSDEIDVPGEQPKCKPVTADSEGPGAAETAGNQVLFEKISDTVVEVRNDTCAEFYLRVWATYVGDLDVDASLKADASP